MKPILFFIVFVMSMGMGWAQEVPRGSEAVPAERGALRMNSHQRNATANPDASPENRAENNGNTTLPTENSTRPMRMNSRKATTDPQPTERTVVPSETVVKDDRPVRAMRTATRRGESDEAQE